MADFLGTILLLVVALAAIAVGAGTLKDIRSGETKTLSRGTPRLVSRSNEPWGFWATMFAGLVWLLLGLFLLLVTAGGVLHYL